MVFNGERTMYNVRLQNYLMLGLPYTPLVNTTLNEKFDIVKKVDIPPRPYPTTNVLVIGTLFKEQDTTLTRLNLKTSPHSPLDAALYNHLPFYIRKVSELNDYPPSDRYVLRKNIVLDNEEYLVCYGYYVDDIIYKGDIVKYANINNEYTNITKIDTNDGSFLNPDLKANLALEKNIEEYLGNFFKLYFFFSKDEITEIQHAFDVLYPNEDVRRINEVGVCSSIKLDDDVMWCGVDYFLDTDFDIDEYAKKGFLEFYLEVGNSEVIRS